MKFRLATLLLALPTVLAAQGDVRVRYTINEGWKFLPDGVEFAEKAWLDDSGWQSVNLPHTWNARDPFDDVESYRRGTSWYRRRLALPDSLRGKRLYLYFEGANQRADVYVNGAWAGSHAGGYTAFAVDITRWARAGAADNLVAVRVDNSHDPQVPPLSVGFALYGGIYRDVWLVATDPVHLTMRDHGSSGVYVTTPAVSRESGTVRVRGAVANDPSPGSGQAAAKRLRVVSTLIDREGKPVAESIPTDVASEPGREAVFEQQLRTVRAPHLWSPDDPYLYSVRTDVYDGERVADRVTSPLGFRWFRFTADSGFFLNGARLFLRGTNRHQDYQGLGSALSNRQHVRDLELIKEMGANFLRLAHYPQDPAVLEAADRLGLLIWEEVPVVNYITVSDEFASNSHRMLREMIRQHHNHPAVVMWGVMNEVFLWSEGGERLGRHTDTTYMRQVRDFARGMDSLARREDPARSTTMAIHGATSYDSSGVGAVTQVLGLNLYNGWYSGTIDQFGVALDKRHRASPRQAVVVSEYGSGSDLRLNSTAPERFDHSGSYHRLYHEGYLRQARARPWLSGTAIWNQFDFSQPHIGESIPQMNQKGMLTFDRRPKDVYYLYKANWNPEPMVYVASRDWTRRAGVGRAATQPVDVYTNLDRVELLVNGRSLGAKQPDDVRKASWEVPFADGENVVEARATRGGTTVVDRLTMHFDRYPADLRDPSAPFREIAVNVGSNAQYADDDGLVWLPDQPYARGGFGYVGGARALMERAVVVTGTSKSALYVTYRPGVEAYRFDVPDGDYEIELAFADPGDPRVPSRSFGVAVNGRTVLERVPLSSRPGVSTLATMATVTASATNGSGLAVSFIKGQGEPILNGIHVRKR